MEPCDKNLGCTKKQKIALTDKHGEQSVVHRCVEIKSDYYAQDVTPNECNTCPFRVTPPKIPVVTATEAKANAPKYHSPIIHIISDNSFAPCDDRVMQTVIQCCGKVGYRRVCTSGVCQYNKKEVTETICASCPLRVVKGVAINDGSK